MLQRFPICKSRSTDIRIDIIYSLICPYCNRLDLNEANRSCIYCYKTGKKIVHEENDINTCLQAVICAYMLEQQGVHVSGCEYRYLPSGTTIKCRYDDDMKSRLDAKLQELKNALDTGNFPYGKDEDTCKYCKIRHICDKQTEAKEEDE